MARREKTSVVGEQRRFDEADVAMMVHPTPDQTAIGGRTLAIESVEIDFIGKILACRTGAGGWR